MKQNEDTNIDEKLKKSVFDISKKTIDMYNELKDKNFGFAFLYDKNQLKDFFMKNENFVFRFLRAYDYSYHPEDGRYENDNRADLAVKIINDNRINYGDMNLAYSRGINRIYKVPNIDVYMEPLLEIYISKDNRFWSHNKGQILERINKNGLYYHSVYHSIEEFANHVTANADEEELKIFASVPEGMKSAYKEYVLQKKKEENNLIEQKKKLVNLVNN